MRKLESLCNRLSRSTGFKWCVVCSSGITQSVRHKYYVYRLDRQKIWRKRFACDDLFSCRRFLLDQFLEV